MLRVVFASALLLATTARADEPPRSLVAAWPETDFSNTSVEFDEIMSGGVPRDGIPAITDPQMISIDQASELEAREPVMTVELPGMEPRAYPVRYLTWHEIVNDQIGSVPIAVTFCPLCNSGLVFDRRLGNQVLEFGVSGLLRFSDMVMYDRQSHSLWQQFTGEAIVGELTGQRLAQVVSWMEPWSVFSVRNSDGLVMAQPTSERRPYGNNPYVGYDSSAKPFLYSGESPPHGVPPLARVLRVDDRAWPLERLSDLGEIEEAGLRIVWEAGMASALDTQRIGEGRDVGSIRVFDASSGKDVSHEVVFAFAFHAFEPAGEWMLGD